MLAILGILLVILCDVTVCSAQTPPPVRIMPLGDSITSGDVDPTITVEGAYRPSLYSRLCAQGFNVDFVGTLSDPDNNPAFPDRNHEGHGGYGIEGIRNEAAFWLNRVPDPDVILLHIGTNDFWAGKSLAAAQESLRNLLTELSSLRPHARIIVASLIPRLDAYEAIQGQFNASIPGIVSEQVALERHVFFVDMHSALLPQDLAADGVHPTLEGYGKMADRWLEAITQVITSLGTSDPPELAKVDASADLEHVTVTFSKPVKDEDVITTNFSLTGGLAILQANFDTVSKRVVTLTTSPQTRSAIYGMSVSGVHDLLGNLLPEGSMMDFTSQTVIDGSFEADGLAWAGTGNVSVSASPIPAASDGMKLVVFNDGQTLPNGMIAQSIPTRPGQKYRLRFDMGVYAFSPGMLGLQLTVTGSQILLAQTATLQGFGGGATKWQAMSIDFVADSASTTISFADVSTDTINIDLLLDHVRLEAVILRTLTVDSTSSGGVNVVVSQPDLGGFGDGMTTFSRSYDNATSVALTAPAIAPDGLVFLKWRKNGVDYASSRTTSVIMGGDYPLTALYVANTSPVAVADSYSGFVETPVTVAAPGVLGNDTDATPNTLAAVLDVGPAHGSLTLNPDGSFTYTPAAGYVGSDSFTYHANDGALDSNLTIVSMTINAAPAGLLVNGSFELGNPSNEGSLYGWNTSGSQFGVLADAGYTATAGRRLAVFSGGGDTFDGVIAQTFPTTIGQPYTVELDMGIFGTAGHMQRLQVTIVGDSTLVEQLEEVAAVAGPAKWTHKGYSFIANSSTTTLALSDASWTLLPSSVARNADLLLDNVRVTAAVARTLTVASSPFNGLNVTVSQPDLDGGGNGVTNFTRSYGNGTVVTLTAQAFPGGYIFQKWQLDGSDLTTNVCATVNIDGPHAMVAAYGVNTAPVANADAYATTLEWPLVVAASGVLGNDTDVESGTLTAVLDTAPAFGNVNLSPNGNFTYIPVTGFTGQDSFTYHANDGGLNSNGVTVTITVNPIGPFTNGSFESGTPLDFGALDGWLVTGNAVGYSSHPPNYVPKAGNDNRFVLFSGGNDVFDGSISQRFATIAGKAYKLEFDMGITGLSGRQQLLQVAVTGEALAPLVSAQEGIAATGLATLWADPPKSYTFVADSTVTTVTLSDASRLLSQAQCANADLLLDAITVTPVNDLPVASAQSVTLLEDSTASITLTGSDIDGDSLSFTVTTPPEHGTLSGDGPNLTYMPTADYNGSDGFAFTAHDSALASAPALVSITVTPVNDAPVASAQFVDLSENGTATITLAGSDVDGDGLSFAVITPPAHGSVGIVGGGMVSATGGVGACMLGQIATYTPAANYFGSDHFTFTVSDGTQASAAATVSITINPLAGFSHWMSGFSLADGPEADSDGDSIRNAVEYVIGGDPGGLMDVNLLPALSLVTAALTGDSTDTEYLLFTYRRTDMAKNDPLTNIKVEWTSDLAGPWTDAIGTPGVVMFEEIGAAAEGVDLVKVYIPCSLTTDGKLFARLGVAVNNP